MSGSIAGLIPSAEARGKKGGKTPPRSYLQAYRNRSDATFPDLLIGSKESEVDALSELFGSRSPTEWKRSALTLRKLLASGALQIVAGETKSAKKQ